jgi:hypothetical protein
VPAGGPLLDEDSEGLTMKPVRTALMSMTACLALAAVAPSSSC